ncbi:MAG: zinc ribbon domain-containing protein [Pirellulaceae bacterium]|jgi:predicted amidophosphoribosyltransferase|nr:zinc ribbon domain-containing protein [Pirellulaceae bacterium]
MIRSGVLLILGALGLLLVIVVVGLVVALLANRGQQQTMECPKCGENSPRSNFCPHCGAGPMKEG